MQVNSIIRRRIEIHVFLHTADVKIREKINCFILSYFYYNKSRLYFAKAAGRAEAGTINQLFKNS